MTSMSWRNLVVSLLCFTLLMTCRTSSKPQASGLKQFSDPRECEHNVCTTYIQNHDVFKVLGVTIPIASLQQTVIKFVYYRGKDSGDRLYFFNTNQYSYHYDFVTQVLGVRISNAQFNRNYTGSGAERDFNLGSLVLHSSRDEKGNANHRLLWELWNGDTMDSEHMQELYQLLNSRIQVPETTLDYHPLSHQQHQEALAFPKEMGYVTTDQLFSDLESIVYNPAEAVGYLTFMDEGTAAAAPCLDFTKIVVFKQVPNDIGLVGGVITEEIQTPLSHINVKSINRGTLNLSLKKAFEKLKQYKDKPVRIRTDQQSGFTVELLTSSNPDVEIAKFWEDRRPIIPGDRQIIADLSKTDFINLESYLGDPANHRRYLDTVIPKIDIHRQLVRTIGAKATNLGALRLMSSNSRAMQQIDLQTPATLGAPFSFYESFMNYSSASQPRSPHERIKNILAPILAENRLHSLCEVREQLAAARNEILKSEVPPTILEKFKKIILDDVSSPMHISKLPRIRLRSSTNSEDLEGFTGAGLYNSEAIPLYKKHKDESYDKSRPRDWKDLKEKLEETLPFLYSSVWNDRAFEEREWFGIYGKKHLDIKVGLAVHHAFPSMDFDHRIGELANGVAISQDIYNPSNEFIVYINGQHLDLAVTNPPTEEELIEVGEDPKKDYLTEEIHVTTLSADPDQERNWRYYSFNVIRHSSIKDGAPVLIDDLTEQQDLSKMEIRRLGEATRFISDAFASMLNAPPEEFVIDTEWKFYGPDRQLYVKQARPFVTASEKSMESERMGMAAMAPAEKKVKFRFGPKPGFLQ